MLSQQLQQEADGGGSGLVPSKEVGQCLVLLKGGSAVGMLSLTLNLKLTLSPTESDLETNKLVFLLVFLVCVGVDRFSVIFIEQQQLEWLIPTAANPAMAYPGTHLELFASGGLAIIIHC